MPLLVEGYVGVVAVLRALRLARGWTQAELDARVGWADGYAGKLELLPGSKSYRRAGPGTLTEWMQALEVPRVELGLWAPLPHVSLLSEPRLRLWSFWAAVEALRRSVVHCPGSVIPARFIGL